MVACRIRPLLYLKERIHQLFQSPNTGKLERLPASGRNNRKGRYKLLSSALLFLLFLFGTFDVAFVDTGVKYLFAFILSVMFFHSLSDFETLFR